MAGSGTGAEPVAEETTQRGTPAKNQDFSNKSRILLRFWRDTESDLVKIGGPHQQQRGSQNGNLYVPRSRHRLFSHERDAHQSMRRVLYTQYVWFPNIGMDGQNHIACFRHPSAYVIHDDL